MRAAAGRTSIAARLTLPLSNGRTHAPTINKSPGCNHSRVIIVLAPHEPELSDDFRHNDNRDAGSESVQRAPGRKILEGKMRFVAAENIRQHDFSQGHKSKTGVKQAFDAGKAPGIFQLPFEKAHGVI